MKLLNKYKNGNYWVYIYDDGTKIRRGKGKFNPVFPESIDIKITNECDANCEWCSEDSNKNNDSFEFNEYKFLDSLRPGMELAIGGGNPLVYKHLIGFLKYCNRRGVIANITINEKNLSETITYLIGCNLVKSFGVSFVDGKNISSILEFLKPIKKEPLVVHFILGIHDLKCFKKLYSQKLKILILGYKKIGRGKLYYNKNKVEIEQNMSEIKDNLDDIINEFEIVFFDN